jgi:hypothetical protein
MGNEKQDRKENLLSVLKGYDVLINNVNEAIADIKKEIKLLDMEQPEKKAGAEEQQQAPAENKADRFEELADILKEIKLERMLILFVKNNTLPCFVDKEATHDDNLILNMFIEACKAAEKTPKEV